MTARQQQQDDIPLYDCGDDNASEQEELWGYHLTADLDYIGKARNNRKLQALNKELYGDNI